MSEDELRGAVAQAAASVLENMFFAEPALCDDSDDPASLMAGVEFEGALTGAMTITLSNASASRLATDFLGLETGELAQNQIADVLTELTNMICGALLSCLEKASTLTLGQPAVVGPEWATRFSGWIHQSFDLGDGRMGVAIAFAQQP